MTDHNKLFRPLHISLTVYTVSEESKTHSHYRQTQQHTQTCIHAHTYIHGKRHIKTESHTKTEIEKDINKNKINFLTRHSNLCPPKRNNNNSNNNNKNSKLGKMCGNQTE